LKISTSSQFRAYFWTNLKPKSFGQTCKRFYTNTLRDIWENLTNSHKIGDIMAISINSTELGKDSDDVGQISNKFGQLSANVSQKFWNFLILVTFQRIINMFWITWTNPEWFRILNNLLIFGTYLRQQSFKHALERFYTKVWKEFLQILSNFDTFEESPWILRRLWECWRNYVSQILTKLRFRWSY
jgi:hypothetical protein